MKVNTIIFFIIVANINLFASFSKQGDIVIDSKTKLMWQDNSDVESNSQNWSNALEYCHNLTLGGYSDWRLPNIRELLSIADKRKYNPAIYSTFKNVVSDYYWSASTYASGTSDAWVVGFEYGDEYWGSMSRSTYVRCVRPE